jgi:hypothetical protein
LASKFGEGAFYSAIDSLANTVAMEAQGSALAAWANGLTIGGFNDWQIPARNVAEVMYRNGKPTTDASSSSAGVNPDSIPVGQNYGVQPPSQSTAAIFRTGGAQTLEAVNYWTSTAIAQYSNTVTVEDPDIPIYESHVVSYNQHARINAEAPNNQQESDGTYLPSNGCNDTPGTVEEDLTFTFYPVWNESQSAWITTWNCPTRQNTLVGYEEGGSHEEQVDHAPAWVKSMFDGAEVEKERDLISVYARAVRLVKVS